MLGTAVARILLAIARLVAGVAMWVWGFGLTVHSWLWVLVPISVGIALGLLDDAIKAEGK